MSLEPETIAYCEGCGSKDLDISDYFVYKPGEWERDLGYNAKEYYNLCHPICGNKTWGKVASGTFVYALPVKSKDELITDFWVEFHD